MADDSVDDTELIKKKKHKHKHKHKHKGKNRGNQDGRNDHPPPSIPGARLSLKRVGILLGAYLALGTVCFFLVRDQITGKKTDYGILDSMYFCVVTMTTVGYGDLVPETKFAKVLACVFVFMGMFLGGFALSKAADYIVEKEVNMFVKAMQVHEAFDPVQMLSEAAEESDKLKYKFLIALILIVVHVIVGIVVLILVEDLSLIDAYYCVCATITTLGYGDKSFTTTGGRIFAVFWILTSTISLAQLFMYLVELWTESRQRQLVDWVLGRKMTVQDIENADLDNDNSVSPAEYVVYKLKEMGLVNDQLIMSVMEGFKTLDVDNSGTLTSNDLSSLSKIMSRR
ncbi:two-pore potassium channel 1-like [Bidens hawaiensis]|uniref:two-pore potassium channel 1-like n=1 Tax=Bidens hawaiensis TaxID=980011 RepID=UPI00404A3385